MNNLEFRSLNNIYFAVIPIICLALMILGLKKKSRIMNTLELNDNSKRKYSNIVLSSVGILLVMLSLLGPQILTGYTEVETKGLDIYVLVDTSKSMVVEDIGTKRIDRARSIIYKLLENLEGDRVGFIPFTNTAYIQLPLTDDYNMAQMFLGAIGTDMISSQGTDIGGAIQLAADSFEKASLSDNVIIILSDGEDQESNSLTTLKKLKLKNTHIYTVGIGTEKGDLIPVQSNDALEQELTEQEKAQQTAMEFTYGKKIEEEEEAGPELKYMTNKDGEYVISRLMPDTLKSLAIEGNGAYYQSNANGDEIAQLINSIDKLKRDTLRTGRVNEYMQIYQYTLGLGMACIVLAYLLPEIRVKEKRRTQFTE